MAFHVRQESRKNAVSREPTVWILGSGSGCRLEVWPARGFNAYRWQAHGHEILYRDPALFDDAKPTRSGWPILFPFPNRIKDGRFAWEGKDYQLPLQDPSGKNAIHGFVATRPWRVVEHGADDAQAWLTAEFESPRDAGDARSQWPGDYCLRITYRLTMQALRVESTVENLGTQPLPFGLGYHPYFRVDPFGGEQACIEVDAGKQWKLIDCLPTGDLSAFSWHEQAFRDVELDHLLTDVPAGRPDARRCGAIESPEGLRLAVQASRDFRELVVFTPPHRQAICFEPYTCITDAINLHQRGIDSGLHLLVPGDLWHGWVQVDLINDPTPAA